MKKLSTCLLVVIIFILSFCELHIQIKGDEPSETNAPQMYKDTKNPDIIKEYCYKGRTFLVYKTVSPDRRGVSKIDMVPLLNFDGKPTKCEK